MSARVAERTHTDRPVVEFDDIACGYEGRPVLERLALSLYPGQFAGIVGPSGSGKTTVLRAILGMAELYHGAVRFPTTSQGGRPRIGYVPQLETIDWSFPVTVEQVVLMGLAAESGPFPWPRRKDRLAMHDLLERLGIGECAKRHIRDLSGGQPSCCWTSPPPAPISRLATRCSTCCTS